jgi:hypothetical protein
MKMRSTRYQQLRVLIYIVCIGLTAFGGYYCYQYNDLRLRSAFANEQIKIFDDMREKALQHDTVEASGCLSYVINYYPSGTKQKEGSPLDLVVERARSSAVKDIVRYLRRTSEKDLGGDPSAWIALGE